MTMTLEHASARLHELSKAAYGVAKRTLGNELGSIADAIDLHLSNPPEIPESSAQPHPVAQGEAVAVEARRCDVCDHIGINDASPTQGACHNCDWQGDEQKDDLCPDCGDSSCMAAACPECGGRYSLVASAEVHAPTIPAGYRVVPPEDRTPWACGDGYDDGYRNGLTNGWNACLDAMLAASPSAGGV